ncbi:ParA family protein [Kouleothrix sp.]|uniref:ParA family protein n=1 Tax=Kouleothrix sp. TaxID=2779161 RepID=UPI0039189F4A
MGRVIAVANAKGGIGKTTTVVSIGAGFALKGARVLLIDADPQGNLALALGLRPRRTLYDVLADGVGAAECVVPARPNLDLLASDETLLSVQPQIARRADWSRALDASLRPLYGAYDLVLIDSGGSLTTLSTNALACATDVIVPTAIEHFSLKSIDLLFAQVAGVKGNSGSIRLIIPTMFDPRVRQSGELLAALRGRYGALVADPIRVNVRLSEAPTLGKTIYEYDPRSRGAIDYALLVERLGAMFSFRASARPANGSDAAPRPATAAPTAVAAAPRGPEACPNCGHALQFATLAGYRVAYCEHCKYRHQTLASGPRR